MQWMLVVLPLVLARLAASSFNIYASYDHHGIAAALGISSMCLLALNQTIECDQFSTARAARGVDNDFWYKEDLTTLCTDTCANSLASWLSAVETECSKDQVTANGIIFEPKAFPLKYIAGYDLACLRDASDTFCILESQNWDGSVYTNWDVESCYDDDPPAYCAEQIFSNQEQSLTVTNLYHREQYCSECFLLLWRQRLLSPTLPPGNFTDYLVDQFKILENTCTTSLPFTMSAPTLIIGTAPTPDPTPTVEATQTPNDVHARSIAPRRSSNGPYYSPASPPRPTQPGAIRPCGAYFAVGRGDTCLSIAEQLDIDYFDLMSYNTRLEEDCSNLWVNYAICVAPVTAQPRDSNDEDEDEYDLPLESPRRIPTLRPSTTSRVAIIKTTHTVVLTETTMLTETTTLSETTSLSDSTTTLPETTSSTSYTESSTTSSSSKVPETSTSTNTSQLPEPTKKPEKPSNVSKDGKCDKAISCVGSGFGDCCSVNGYCGSGPLWCGLGNCISGPCDNRPGQISTDGTCGPLYLGDKTCIGSKFGDCCSKRGYCGSTAAHCAAENCHSGKCEGRNEDGGKDGNKDGKDDKKDDDIIDETKRPRKTHRKGGKRRGPRKNR